MWWALAACSPDAEPPSQHGGHHNVPSDVTSEPTGHTTTDPTPTEPAVRRYDCSGMDPADPAPLGGHVILTFDDGPDLTETPILVDLLRSRGIPATFMMLGESASDPAAADLVRDIAGDPLFGVGNHTWDHTDLATVGLATAESEIDDTTAALGELGIQPRFFRFPYGDATCAAHDLATDRGFRVAGWHIDPADWCYAAHDGVCTTDDYWRVPPEYEDDMIGLAMEQIRRFDGGVVLFHDIHAWTVDHMAEFVDAVLAEGYSFAALDDASILPNLAAGTPADLPFLGERCSVSDDRCWEVEHAAWCAPTADGSDDGICTLPCEGYCLDRDGAPTTFCADVGGEGRCVARSDAIDDRCAALPGTVETEADRYVGASGAPSATTAICSPADGFR